MKLTSHIFPYLKIPKRPFWTTDRDAPGRPSRMIQTPGPAACPSAAPPRPRPHGVRNIHKSFINGDEDEDEDDDDDDL